MKAGFARIDVTPPIGSKLIGYYSLRVAEDVITPLEANAVAISDGENTALLISIDNLSIMKREMDIMKDLITKQCGIPYENIFISCTHTHLGPSVCVEHLFPPEPDYTEAFFKKIRDVAFFAIKDLKNAVPYIAKGEAKDIAFVRRFRMKDGTIKTNPTSKHIGDVLGPCGEPDEQLQLIKFVRKGASDIAIVNFQVHPDVIGGNKICADYPGFLRKTLEAALCDEADGKGVRVVYFNGTQGDTVHARRIDKDGNFTAGKLVKSGVEQSRHMGRVLAGAVLSIYTHAELAECGRVFGTVRYVKVESNKGTPEELELARKVKPLYDEGGSEAIKELGMPINVAVRILALENTLEWVDVNISCVGFGEIAFVGFPGEPFTYVGRTLKENSPFTMTVPCCLTGGSMSYFPTRDAFEGGGYETGNARFKKGIAEMLADEAITLTKEAHEALRFEEPVEPELWDDPNTDRDYAYSIAFVGDPQYITCGDYYLNTKKMDKLFFRLAETAKERKVEHVFILGDLTDMGYLNDANLSYGGISRKSVNTKEWEISKKAVLQLNEVGIPYSICRGNHDDYQIDDFFNVPEYTNQFVGCGGFFSDSEAKYPKCREPQNPEGYVYWSAKTGYHKDSIVNSWKTVELCGVKYLFVTVDYNATKAVADWLDEILGKYPEHRAIVTTHSYLTRGGGLIQSEKGDTMFPSDYPASRIWDDVLRKHSNVLMVVSGHIGATVPEYSWNTGDNGNKVFQLLVDPQDYDAKEIKKEGEIVIEHGKQDTGLVLYMNFSADGRTIKLDHYSTLLNKSLKLKDYSITLDVQN